MILEKETYEKFGYYPGDLKPKSNKKILAKCDKCGKIRDIPKEYYRALCFTCARDLQKAENAANWKGGKAQVICQFCGKPFPTDPSRIKWGRGKFCSRYCARRGQKGFPTHHTKPERIFEEICKKNNLPFKYTGDSSFWIGRNPSINPDFVECNGKKIAIEIFSYWHDPLRRHCKIPYSQTYEGRNKILKKYGWKLVVFWQEDLEREDAEQFVLNKIQK